MPMQPTRFRILIATNMPLALENLRDQVMGRVEYFPLLASHEPLNLGSGLIVKPLHEGRRLVGIGHYYIE